MPRWGTQTLRSTLGFRGMKKLLPRVITTLITTLVLTCIMQLLVIGLENLGQKSVIEKEGLGPVLEQIDQAGVDKRTLSAVLQSPPSFARQFFYQFAWVAIVVSLYTVCGRFGARLLKRTTGASYENETKTDTT